MTRARAAATRPLRLEAAVQRESLKLFRAYGIVLRRRNTRVVTLPGKGGRPRPVFFGQAGDLDSDGQMPDGRRIDVEFKREGWTPLKLSAKDRARWEKQLARMREVNGMGGVALWINDPAQVHAIAPKLLAGWRVMIDDDGWPYLWTTDDPHGSGPLSPAS